MKKTYKKTFLGIGIVIILIVLVFAGYMLKARSEMKVMDPVETTQIVDGIFSLKDTFVNMYIIQDSIWYIAVDAANNAESVSEELKKLNINPDLIIALFLTHSDGDHVGALKLFKNAKVYLSKQEEKMINGEKSRFLFFGNKIAAKEYTLIEDQQIISIGNLKIKGILTSGHTPGSMCFLLNDKYLFTGDALGLKDSKIAAFNKFFNMDTPCALHSIMNITHFPDAEYIFTAHYGYCDNYKNAVKDWKE